MIKILPLKNDEVLQSLNQKEKTSARLAYYLEIEGEPVDYILYNLTKDEGIIQAVSASEDAIADVLVRAVLASLYDFGINRAIYNINMDNELLSRLSFVKKGEWATVSIEDVLYNCKNCKK